LTPIEVIFSEDFDLGIVLFYQFYYREGDDNCHSNGFSLSRYSLRERQNELK